MKLEERSWKICYVDYSNLSLNRHVGPRGRLATQVQRRRAGAARPARPVVIPESQSQALTTLRQWSEECDHLIGHLRKVETTDPSVRPMLAEAVQLRVNVELLSRQAASAAHPGMLVPDFQVIDRQWRTLKYHLERMPSTTPAVLPCIELCNQYDERLCGILRIQPQFDTQLVLELASQLSTDLGHLEQNLRYEVRKEPDRSDMMRTCRSLRGMVQQSLISIRRGDYQAVTKLYKNGLAQWRSLSRTICYSASARLRHDVQEIEGIGRQIQEALYLPYEPDREYLAQLAQSIGSGSMGVFEQITLQDLLLMENPTVVLEAARTFERQCDGFNSALRNNATPAQLTQQFVDVDRSWNRIYSQCRSLPNQSVALEETNYSMQTLRESFGAAPMLDHPSMLRVSAELESLSHQLEDMVSVAPKSIARPVKKFSARCYQLNREAMADRFYEPKTSDLNALVNLWTQLKRAMRNYRGPNYTALNSCQQQIEPLMVKLQVIYGQ